MELRLLRTGQPLPDLMSAAGPQGVTLASVHIDRWHEAVSDVIAASLEGAAARPSHAARSPSCEYVDPR